MKTENPATLNAEELENAFEPIMCLRAILARAGECEVNVDADDVARVLGAVLHSAYTRIGYPVRGGIL